MKVRNVYRKVFFVTVAFSSVGALAQSGAEPIFSNKGVFEIKKETLVSSLFPFVNQQGGNLTNNGDFTFFDNFKNEGFFGFDASSLGGQVTFIKEGSQILMEGGDNVTSFRDVIFDSEKGLDLTNEINIAGVANFTRGHVRVSSKPGDFAGIAFYASAEVTNQSDGSHVVGEAEVIGAEEFTFPIGDGNYLRPMSISENREDKKIFSATYLSEDPTSLYPHMENKDGITLVDNVEYWDVAAKSPSGAVLLSLTWDDRVTPTAVFNPVNGNALRIVRWDQSQSKWIDEGGEVDQVNKVVTTAMPLEANGVFTLASVRKNIDSNVVIYNSVTANGDGMNDYFIIKNINQYPNNSVEIVNRWGSRVFYTKNYDPNGDGSSNVFDGTADGKGVIGGKKLPSGTYYYIVNYEFTDGNGSRMIKEAGYLNLENN